MEHRPDKPSQDPQQQDNTSEQSPNTSEQSPNASVVDTTAANSSKEPPVTNPTVTETDTPAQDPPPLPDEPPPLPKEDVPGEPVDDGWEPVWDDSAQAFYFYNRFTNVTQWENPRISTDAQAAPPGVGSHDRSELTATPTGGYNPAIHGDYDPNADYAKSTSNPDTAAAIPGAPGTDPADAYGASGAFNRFTGKWQNADFTTERFSDEAKSKRQMNAFFDVDAAANSHDGRSLRAERASKKLSKKELKDFKEKRREKKEEKRRAWLRD